MLVHIPNFLSKLIFRSFDARDIFLDELEQIRRENPKRPIAIALVDAGLIEFVALRLFLWTRFEKNFELKLATGYSKYWVENLWMSVKRVAASVGLCAKPLSRIKACQMELMVGNPVVINFQPRDIRSVHEIPKTERHLAYLQETVPDLLVVGVAFVWRRIGKRVQSEKRDTISWIAHICLAPFLLIWKGILGDPYNPRGPRKMLIMARGYSRSTLRIVGKYESGEYSPRELRRKLILETQEEKRAVLGPIYKDPMLLADQIFREQSFHEMINRVSLESETPVKTLRKRALSYLKEIAADYRYFVVETVGWLLGIVFNRIYEKITFEKEELEHLRQLSKRASIVFIPNHRSYLDFLIFNYLLYREQMSPPHILAGKNLNFWPVGGIFRRGGAFFVRRSFRGNVVYREVLKRYVYSLLNNDISIKFFIEGTRSRNGKLAPPKFGFLKMLIESQQDKDLKRPAYIVPVSINYDRVTEEQAHKRELEGGAKPRESALNAVRSIRKVLRQSYGKVHIRCSREISLEGWVDKHSESSRFTTQKLAFEVSYRINQVSPLTGIGLVCSVLLMHPGTAITLKRFQKIVSEVIEKDLRLINCPLSEGLSENFLKECKRALARLIDEKIAKKYTPDTGGLGVRISSKQRIGALYYKNSVIHAFLIPAIASLTSNLEEANQLRRFLSFEYFFPEKEQFNMKWEKAKDQFNFNIYGILVEDVLEGIETGLKFLKTRKLLKDDKKNWVSKLMKYGKQRLMSEEITRRESFNTQGFKAFLELALNQNWLEAQEDGTLSIRQSTDFEKPYEYVQGLLQKTRGLKKELVQAWTV